MQKRTKAYSIHLNSKEVDDRMFSMQVAIKYNGSTRDKRYIYRESLRRIKEATQ